ncbi:hypothetical protein H1Q59_07810 [Holosporaceae bacterium 'Namur']|nr:hypothetical protein [Holosporaceae bacterium 'Namur']
MKNNTINPLTNDPEILKIIKAARNQDYTALEGIFINLRDKKTGFHAATILAYNRETGAIKFLKPYILGIDKDISDSNRRIRDRIKGILNSEGIDLDRPYKNTVAKGFIMGGHTDFALEWIEKGADVNIAVSIAAKQGNNKLVTLLLDNYKASIWAAVASAAECEHEELVNSLLARGVDISTAISGAARGGHRNLTHRLLEQAKNEDNYEYALNKAVREAAGYEHKELAEWLIEEYKANPLEALNGAIWNKSFNFATYLISNYKILPEKISASYNDDLKSYFKKKKYNIYSFLSGITDNELRKAYIHHTAAILDISPDKLSNNFSSILKTMEDMEDQKLSFNDAYVYYVEKKYIACGISTPLGDYVASFYKVYTANAPITTEGIVIPSEILNKIAHFYIEHPKLNHNDKSNKQKYPPLSESGINKVIDLWLSRINEVCFAKIKAQASELALLITTAYNDSFPAVIINSVNGIHNPVTSFRDKLTEEKSDGRGNQI